MNLVDTGRSIMTRVEFHRPRKNILREKKEIVHKSYQKASTYYIQKAI